MSPVLFLAALLSVADPQGDAIGQGNLTPPTAVVFRAPGIFDAQQITVPDADTFGFELTMGQLSNPWRLANGFSFPIIEVYLSTKSGGQNTLLPGSNMRLPEGQGWHYAFRLTGDRFDVYRATEQGMPVQVTDMIGAQLEVVGNTLHVRTNLPLPERYSIFGMVGSYDPFTETGWRVVTDTPNPWAFSSREPSVPVIDVIADSFSMQRAALAQGVLPEIRSAVRQDAWLIVAAVGFAFMVVAAFGQLLLPKRAAKRSLAAANQAIKAPSQAASSAPTKPKTPHTSPHTSQRTAHQAARAKPPTSTSPATGRGSRGKQSNNAARGLARQQAARASQAPNADQPVPLGDKLVLAPNTELTLEPTTEPALEPTTQTFIAKATTDEAPTKKTATSEISADMSSTSETSTSETSTSSTTQPTTKTLRPPPDNALRPRSAPGANAPVLETAPVASSAVTDALPELVTKAVLDAKTYEKISEIETAEVETEDTETADVETAAARSAHAVTDVSPEQDVSPEDAPQISSPSSLPSPLPAASLPAASSQGATEQTPVESSATAAASQTQPQTQPRTQPKQQKALPKKRRAATSPRATPQSSADAPTPQKASKMNTSAATDTAAANTSDTDASDTDLLPAERIRRERLARQSQHWEDDFFDDGWFDWQTSQAVFEDDDA